MARKKIVVINPSTGRAVSEMIPKHIPLAILSVASTLVDKYDVVLIDRNLGDSDEKLLSALEDRELICVAISCLTGPGLLDAENCSKMVKEKRPDVQVVWGGWHAIIAPESILLSPFVDFIIRGEGEWAFRELLDEIGDIEKQRSVAGVGYMKDNELKLVKLLPIKELDSLPPLPLGLLPAITPYIYYNAVEGGGRCVSWETSRGCPHSCAFCDIANRFGISYSCQSAEKMISDIKHLQERYDIGGIRFYDANLFLKLDRIKSFSKLLIENGMKLKWSGSGTINQFKNIPIETLKLFYDAGLRHVEFGIESGNEGIRYTLLNKRFKNEHCEKVMRNFRETNLQFKFNMIVGFPGETMEQSMQTVDYALDIITKNPNSSIGGHIYMYMPFPGTALYEKACEMGYKAPKSMKEFAKIDYTGSNTMPWVSTKQKKVLEVVSLMTYFLSAPAKSIPFNGAKKLLFRFLRAVYIFRLRKKMFAKTPDLMILNKILF